MTRARSTKKSLKVFATADDFGISQGITDTILDAVDGKAVTAVGVAANGCDFERAMEQLRLRGHRFVFVHLNLTQGKPLLPPAEVNLLVDRRGCFRHSFASLWFSSLRAGTGKRAGIAHQVRSEIGAQIRKVKENLPPGAIIGINSHEHVHAIPFVFKALYALHSETPFDHCRMQREPFFLYLSDWPAIRAYLGPNLIKHFLLRYLSRRHSAMLAQGTKMRTSRMVGVLHTGRMRAQTALKALSGIKPQENDDLVEILFHPGQPLPAERELYTAQPRFRQAQCSPWREIEREEARKLRAIIDAETNTRFTFLGTNEELQSVFAHNPVEEDPGDVQDDVPRGPHNRDR